MIQVKVEPTLFVFILLMALIFIVIGPFIEIWAVNTLFKSGIEYSWMNWVCVIILNSSIGAWSYRGK
jgi:hypothetical protein